MGTVITEHYTPEPRGRFSFIPDPAACAGQTPCPVGAEGGTFDLPVSASLM